MSKNSTLKIKEAPSTWKLQNEIIGKARFAEFKFGEMGARLQWKSFAKKYRPKFCLALYINEHEAPLFIDTIPALSVICKEFEGIRPEEDLNQEILSIVLNSFIEELLSELNKNWNFKIRYDGIGIVYDVERFTYDKKFLDQSLFFKLSGDDDSCILNGNWLLPEKFYEEFKDHWNLFSKSYSNNILESCNLPFLLKLGHASLDFKSINTLKENDIILIDNYNDILSKKIALEYKKLSLIALLEDGKLELKKIMKKEDEDLNQVLSEEDIEEHEDNDDDDDSLDEDESDLEDVEDSEDESDLEEGEESEDESSELSDTEQSSEEEIEEPNSKNEENEESTIAFGEISANLTFDIGHYEIAFNELQKIQEGYIFETDKSLESPVNIRLGSNVIGRGELVKINDRVGVKIKNIKSNGNI